MYNRITVQDYSDLLTIETIRDFKERLIDVADNQYPCNILGLLLMVVQKTNSVEVKKLFESNYNDLFLFQQLPFTQLLTYDDTAKAWKKIVYIAHIL